MGFLNGMRFAQSVKDSRDEKARRAVEDAWLAESRGRQRDEWTRADSERNAADAARSTMLGRVKDGSYDTDYESGSFLQRYGLSSPNQGQAFAPASGLRQPQAQEAGDYTGMPTGPEMQQAPAPQQRRVNPMRQQLIDQMELARARRDDQGFSAAQQAYTKMGMDEAAANVYQSALNASPEQMAKWAEGFSNNQHVRGKINFDPRTNMSTLQLDGGGAVQMTRPQAAKYVAGLWKLSRGDASGLGDLESIDKNLAESAKADLDRMGNVTRTNNDASYKGQSLANDAQRNANQAAYQNGMLGISRDRNRLMERREDQRDAQGAAATQFGNQIDGVLEGYQSASQQGLKDAAAIYAREYDQLRATAAAKGLKVPPNLASLVAAQKQGGPAKMVEVAEEGKVYRDPNDPTGQGIVRSDGRGGYVAENGIMPGQRAAALAQAGVPAPLAKSMRWNRSGTEVLYRGMAYDMTNPQDVRALQQATKQYPANDVNVDELQRQDMHTANDQQELENIRSQPTWYRFGPRTTFPN